MKEKISTILYIMMALIFLLLFIGVIPWLIGLGIMALLMVIVNVLDGDNLFDAIGKAIFSDSDNETTSNDNTNDDLPYSDSYMEKKYGYKSSDKLGAIDALLGSYCSKCKFYDEKKARCDKLGYPTDSFSTCNWYES